MERIEAEAMADAEEAPIGAMVALVHGRTPKEDGGERGLLLRLLQGFNRGESSHWALAQIRAFTPDADAQSRLMGAVMALIR